MQLAETGLAGAVVIFPSDHYVSDDAIFMDHVSVAPLAAELDPRMAVILGIKPDYPETPYGWIERPTPEKSGRAEKVRLVVVGAQVEICFRAPSDSPTRAYRPGRF
jgi:mannose-1-phosphate guanylyltransferase